MSDIPIEVGQPGPDEARNPFGWCLIAVLALLMISMQLNAYLTPSPKASLLRARIEDKLRIQIESGTPFSSKGNLDQWASELRPRIAGDAATTLLFAIVVTEAGKPVPPEALKELQKQPTPLYQTAYRIYSSPTLTSTQAGILASQIPQDSFIHRLISVQAYEKAKVGESRSSLRKNPGALLVVGLGVLGIIFVGLAIWIGYFAARSMNLLRPLGLRLGGLSGPDADRLAFRCGQIFFFFLAISFLASFGLAEAVGKDLAGILVYVVLLAVVLGLSFTPVGGKFISLRSLGISKDKFGQHILWGLGAALANGPVLFVVSLATSSLFKSLPPAEHPVTIELSGPLNALVLIQILLTASFFAPIIEEIMFRGLLFPALASVTKNPLLGAVISSFLFASIHPTGIPAWPGLFCIAAMSCFLTYQTRSLVPSIVMHAVHNFGTLLFALLLLR